jgi:hypothetical protein
MWLSSIFGFLCLTVAVRSASIQDESTWRMQLEQAMAKRDYQDTTDFTVSEMLEKS